MRSNIALILPGLLLAVWPPTARTQAAPAASQSSLKINFPADSPLSLLSAYWGESNVSARGGATLLDLHTSLSLRNSSQRRVRSVTLLVLAQEVTPGGKASVAIPSLDVAPGEAFPVRLDLRLLRPLQRGKGPLVEVRLDGVLFEDLSFFGPNRLNSRRSMTAWEMEARRDRRHFKSILEAGGPESLRKEVLTSLSRQAERPGLDVQFSRATGRATNTAPERDLQFAFLRFPDSPLQPMSGMARIAGNEARAPHLEVLNRSKQAIQYFEIGWILRDEKGQEYLAGSVPADLVLAPGQKKQVLQENSLRFTYGPGKPVEISGITGFVSHVEFQDGSVWIPSRNSLKDPRLQRVIAPSPEEQRLTELYRKKGLKALIEELQKF